MLHRNFLGLDVGTRRIGVAIARDGVRLATPLTTLLVDGTETEMLRELIETYHVDHLVVGYPRNQSGDPTEQSRQIVAFMDTCAGRLKVPYSFQDESLTSVMAETRLSADRKPYTKADIDAQAAVMILQDYLEAL